MYFLRVIIEEILKTKKNKGSHMLFTKVVLSPLKSFKKYDIVQVSNKSFNLSELDNMVGILEFTFDSFSEYFNFEQKNK